MSKYFDELMKYQDEQFKEEALDHNVPIIKDDSLKLILFLLVQISAKKVLEIGTAVGYSSINMVKKCHVKVDTIERDEKMYLSAIKNIKDNNLENDIRVFNADALEINNDLLEKQYDLIFIDGAKAQYQKFFEKYEGLLSPNGLIICDNLLFHGFLDKYVTNEEIEGSRNLKALIRKIDVFNKWLSTNNNYITYFLDIGDGVSISKKR